MKFKKIVLIITAILMLCALVSCGNDDPAAPEGCVEISADGIGYNFYMLKSWQAGEQSGMTSAMVSEFDTSNISMMGFDAGDARSAEEYWVRFSEEFENVLGEITYEEEGTNTTLGGKKIKLHKTIIAPEKGSGAGKIVVADKRLVVACGDGNCVEILELQAEGKKAMNAADFLRGNAVEVGSFME